MDLCGCAGLKVWACFMRHALRGIRKFLPLLLLVLLTEGEVTKIAGTDLTIAVKTVKDFTSQGCLGGPVGCQDHVELEVAHRKESRQITLYVAQTEFQKDQGVHRTSVFGYEIMLIALQRKQVVLNVGN